MDDQENLADKDLDVLMAASKVFTAVLARSLEPSDRTITAAQLRVLVVLEERRSTNLSGMAGLLGIDRSTASRTCDHLVRAGMVSRAEDPRDRRHVTLRLTRRGAGVLSRIMARRRTMLAQVMAGMSTTDRRHLVRGLRSFVDAADR